MRLALTSDEEIQETHYLTSSIVNAVRLAEAINEVEAMIADRKF